ncbi:MAG: hypothetical protein ABIU77_14940 [Ferruginibacter sp.]
MKKFFFLSSFVATAILLTLQGNLTSCTKTTFIKDTVTVIKVDTLITVKVDTLQEKDTMLTAAILTANSWKLQSDRATVGGSVVFYERGGSANTNNFDNEFITFNANNTGTYHNNDGGQTTFTWSFTNAANTKLTWFWNTPSPITVTWENISYDDASIRYTEYYTQSGLNVLSSIIRTPK